MSYTVEELLGLLEEKATQLQKTQANIKKCPKSRLTPGYLSSRLESIEGYWQNFNKYHDTLVKCVPKAKQSNISYFVNDDYFTCEELYICMKADLKDLLSSFSTEKQVHISTDPSEERQPLVKLPIINLPTFAGMYKLLILLNKYKYKFAGNYEGWQTFNDLFTSLVHQNTSLSNVQKLHYLKTSVIGEAEGLLKHIQVTESNYEQALLILRQRYGNKRLIVNSLFKRLFGQKKIVTPTSGQLKALLDTTNECLNNLKNLNIRTDDWGPILIFHVVQKLDPDTHKAWEEHAYKADHDVLPTWEELRTFLEGKFRTLELIAPSTSAPRENKPVREKTFHINTATSPTTTKTCIMCSQDHTLCHCKEFIQLQSTERSEYAKSKNLCYNCLIPGHSATKCRLRMNCRICNGRHHTLLHQPRTPNETNQTTNVQTHHSQVNQEGTGDIYEEKEPSIKMSSHLAAKSSTALLATALIPVLDDRGQIHVLRALIDQGSQANFISERATQQLRLQRTPAKGTITGVGSTQMNINQGVQLKLISRYELNYALTIQSYVMPTRLTTQLPSKSIVNSAWSHLEGLTLADPTYQQPGRVDMLLGVEVYAQILKNDFIKGPPGSPSAQHTTFGWILFGTIQDELGNKEITVMLHNVNIDEMLQVLWEVEDDKHATLTKEDKKCEQIYNETYQRDEDGRYIVKLPFKTEAPESMNGNTKNNALKRLRQLEKRFERNKQLEHEYKKVMEEYIQLNHMAEVPSDEIEKPAIYLPHHAVIKETSETTRVRAVFDASCPGSNNISLNDELLKGLQLQDDMRDLVMRWRLKRIGYVADINKMYRQIKVQESDADYQRILWRSDDKGPVKDYRMLRVTFGTACAPYLAVKTLQQVANDEQRLHPCAAETIKKDFYMDDLITGQDTEEDAIDIAKGVKAILKRGGFELQKWSSNSLKLLREIEEKETNSLVSMNMKLDGRTRTLGLIWNIKEDKLCYNHNLSDVPEKLTKRTILAEIQRFFDPLGWIAPSILPAKMMIQELWLQRRSWDEELLPETKRKWLEIRESLEGLKDISIERWLKTTKKSAETITVHGFCDSSTKAYGAVAYIRVKNHGEYKTSLIAAKTRVAPVKPLSLPRLELCGAVLLSKLLKQISEAMQIRESQIYAWTDSTIVLSWLQGEPNRWQTFVRNRVVTILDNIGDKWLHVKSEDNPADLASRGMLLPELKENSLWWTGPEWLADDDLKTEKPRVETTNIEAKTEKLQTNLKITEDNTERKTIMTKFEEFDTLTELLRSISHCKRFLKRRKEDIDLDAALTTAELHQALETCVAIAQEEDFRNEIMTLKEGKTLKKGVLKNLDPFLGDHNILKVGGRLQHSALEKEMKHPMILEHNNPLVKLIIQDAHKKTLHGGIQLTLNYVRQRFWITRGKSTISRVIRRCLICARHRATPKPQQMGNLPKSRVTPARPFLNSGVDFAGPLSIRMSKGRGTRCFKAYICIFICMATKAVHLELVGDLTTNAFVAAFKRFVARRGKCSNIWSDRGTNFVGADRELRELWHEAKLDIPGHLVHLLAEDGTQWHFIPPYSPNFGGLWEAGVKSIKYHLKRILNETLTYEEMATTLCQIEACLNSRPLCPIDNADPDSVEVLTPGHFLIGEAPINTPEPDLKDVSWSRLSRWQHARKLTEDFWRKWQGEYLVRLQQRPKWLQVSAEFKIGDIVLIKEANLPPGKWLMGRIVEKHPGPDNLCRVYSLKCGGKIIKRSISKLCNLPLND